MTLAPFSMSCLVRASWAGKESPSKGTSVLRSTYVIHRGYEDLAERLTELGADIVTFSDL